MHPTRWICPIIIALVTLPACSSPVHPTIEPDTSRPQGDGGSDGGPPPPRSGGIAMVLYPGFTSLDLIGPHTVFSSLGSPEVHLVSKTLDPVTSDTGVTIHPTLTFADTPQDLDVLFVPGTLLGLQALEDKELLDFVRSRGESAKLVTSVCTGSLFLGAAGLLEGYEATSHWSTRHLLSIVGAEPVRARWVEDGNRITGAGVTAGIDFGLVVASRLKNHEAAQGTQLLLEYAPEPPFDAGTPETAPESVRSFMTAFLAPFVASAETILEKAAAER
jgi:cyclohexyl-isocyanide hydratase